MVILAFGPAMTVCASGIFLLDAYTLGGSSYVRTLYPAILLLVASFIALLALVTLSVALVAGDRISVLWHGLWHFRAPSNLRTLMVAVAVFATFLGLLVFAERSFQLYRKARAHADSGQVYRWLQGLDSDFAGNLSPRLPASELWTPKQLGYLHVMEGYHQHLSQEYYTAAFRPWLPVPPDPAEPAKPEDELGNPLTRLWDLGAGPD
jgi:hypothetical protein